jgi:uncharacterized membrane protein
MRAIIVSTWAAVYRLNEDLTGLYVCLPALITIIMINMLMPVQQIVLHV